MSSATMEYTVLIVETSMKKGIVLYRLWNILLLQADVLYFENDIVRLIIFLNEVN